MRIALVSKYPPIEGQVSTTNLWLARGLAHRGHYVVVVTNASEAEAPCRIWIEEGEKSWLEPCFPGGGNVKVLETAPFGREQFHVPSANPFVTKLAALALRGVRELGCELIFSHYLEPYAVAGHMAATWTGVPHVITHAGSDIGRLMRCEALAPTYAEVIRNATRFVPKNSLAAKRSGAVREGLDVLGRYAPPPELFSPSTAALDVNALLARAAGYVKNELGWHAKDFDPDITTFGFYGKLSAQKGLHDLITALRLLKDEGRDFNVLVMSRWHRGEEELRQHIRACGLEVRTWLLPLLPNWRIPEFLRRCHAVCYLNRDFPIEGHTPVIPLEVAACGTCLIISEEVRGKRVFNRYLRDLQTCIAVRDPRDTPELASRLRLVLDDPVLATRIGASAHVALAASSDHDRFISGWETVLAGIRRGAVT